MSYIVKNCPASSKEKGICYPLKTLCLSNEDFVSYYCYGLKKPCKDISDCLLKQIANKCKSDEESLIFDVPEQAKNGMIVGRMLFAKDILDLMKIEEFLK